MHRSFADPAYLDTYQGQPVQLFIRRNPAGVAAPVVASLPHSGLHVPAQIDELFEDEHRRWLRNTDWFLPELYSFLPELGVTMLTATHSRYVVDLNRDPQAELHGGFARALIARRTAHGARVYRDEQDPRALRARISAYHAPYHQALRALLDDTVSQLVAPSRPGIQLDDERGCRDRLRLREQRGPRPAPVRDFIPITGP